MAVVSLLPFVSSKNAALTMLSKPKSRQGESKHCPYLAIFCKILNGMIFTSGLYAVLLGFFLLCAASWWMSSSECYAVDWIESNLVISFPLVAIVGGIIGCIGAVKRDKQYLHMYLNTLIVFMAGLVIFLAKNAPANCQEESGGEKQQLDFPNLSKECSLLRTGHLEIFKHHLLLPTIIFIGLGALSTLVAIAVLIIQDWLSDRTTRHQSTC